MTLAEIIERLEKATGPDRELDALIDENVEFDTNGGCWLWSGKTFSTKGRERPWISRHGTRWLAHRLTYFLSTGQHPRGGFVCHHCDVPLCVRPDHLYLGDHATNMRDMTERRRFFAATQPERARNLGQIFGACNDWTAGEGNPKAKLTAEQAREIRMDRRKTKTLAEAYGVDRTTIQRIRRGSLWTAC